MSVDSTVSYTKKLCLSALFMVCWLFMAVRCSMLQDYFRHWKIVAISKCSVCNVQISNFSVMFFFNLNFMQILLH